MHRNRIKTFEDARWDSKNQQETWRHRAAFRLVIESPVLDVGGGDGLFLTLLRERKGLTDLKLLDISPVAVEKARRKGLDAEVVDITQPLPFPDNFFGTVCALDVLEHLYDPLALLQELARVGRSIVIVVPNFHYWKGRVEMLVGAVPFQCEPKRGHVYWFNYPILMQLIGQAELQLDRLVTGAFIRFGPLGNWLARLHPNLFAHSFGAKLSGKKL